MFKLPDHIYLGSHYTSLNNKYTSEFESEDVNVWTKFFDRSQTLNDEDRNRINHVFNKLVTSIVKYEREQDFQLLEALAKRILSNDKYREENDEPLLLTASDPDRLNKLRTLCKRLKHYHFTNKLLSTMFIRHKSNELILPPIKKPTHPNRSSLSSDGAVILFRNVQHCGINSTNFRNCGIGSKPNSVRFRVIPELQLLILFYHLLPT